MPEAAIELRRIEPVTVMTLADGKANAFDAAMLDAISRTIDTVVAEGARALVITGDGGFFSGGLALPAIIDLDRAAMRTLMDTLKSAMLRVLQAPLPVVAAINGNAIAGGCVLALMCDERIMVSHGAKATPQIGLKEAQLGLGLPAVVLEVARARVPVASHTRVMLQGELFDPRAALAVGLVDDVVAPEQFEARALERAAVLAGTEPTAYAQIKRALTRPLVETIARHDEEEAEAWLATWFAPEAQRRLRATVDRITKK